MPVINKFDDLDHLRSYINDTLNNSTTIYLTKENIQQIAESYSLSPSLINDVNDHTEEKYYLFSGSKTVYRKTVHSFIPNVLYKRMNNIFKLRSVIRESNGSIVVLCPTKITQEVFDEINSTSEIDNQKVLSQLIDNFSNVSSDNQYYVDYIKALENENLKLNQIINDLSEQLNNTKISTWY